MKNNIMNWEADILGEGYESLSIDLGRDEEGAITCTLIAHRTHKDKALVSENLAKPKFALLYIHGWNDYFFQTELAQQIAKNGGAFYAVDLRKYGRSLKQGQSHGYVSDLRTYDKDINACFKVIRSEVGTQMPLLLMGHSTGGLVASLWADRHPDVLSGLILNSPWLELQIGANKRPLLQAITTAISVYNPKQIIPLGGLNHYGHSLKGWDYSDGPLPQHLRGYEDDPAVKGFDIHPVWKNTEGVPVRAGWLKAILQGHSKVAKGLKVTCPVHLGCTKRWGSPKQWSPQLRRMDCVLNSDLMTCAVANISANVTIQRFDGKHDLTLSDPDVRQDYYKCLSVWLSGLQL